MTQDTPLETVSGQCLCGAVTVRITPPRAEVEVCHCGMCRRWGGGAHLGMPMVKDPEIEGEEHIVRYRSSEWAERAFCGKCGTHLYFHYIPGQAYGFTAGLFDDLAGFTMTEEIFIDEKPDYYGFEGDRERLTGPEVMAKFGVGQS